MRKVLLFCPFRERRGGRGSKLSARPGIELTVPVFDGFAEAADKFARAEDCAASFGSANAGSGAIPTAMPPTPAADHATGFVMPALRKASATFCCCAVSASRSDAEPGGHLDPCGVAPIGSPPSVRAAKEFKSLTNEVKEPAPDELAAEKNDSDLPADSENLETDNTADKGNPRAET